MLTRKVLVGVSISYRNNACVGVADVQQVLATMNYLSTRVMLTSLLGKSSLGARGTPAV